MIRVQFYSDCNFSNFLSEVTSLLGEVPGTAHEASRHLTMTTQEYERVSTDLNELARDYGGRILHHKSV